MSEKRYRDFLDYWDSRLDENEKILNGHPQLANFTFRECNKLWDTLHSDYNKLKSRHNALREAVVHVYNSGYLAGHHDTVEGGYVDIHSNDMDTHHKEEVSELLSFLLEKK